MANEETGLPTGAASNTSSGQGNRAARREASRPAAPLRTPSGKRLVREIDDEPYEAPPFSLAGIRNSMTGGAWKAVLILLIFIFAVGSFIVGGGPTANLPLSRTGQPLTAPPDPVATVAGQDITQDDLKLAMQQQVQMQQMFGQQPGPNDWLVLKQGAMRGLAGRAALLKAAQDAGVRASDAEIDEKINKLLDDYIKQNSGENPANFRRQVEQEYGSMQAFRDKMREQYSRDKVADSIVAEKYEKQWKEEHKVTEADYLESVTKYDLSQIMVRIKPPLPNDKNEDATFEKNKAEAKAKAEGLTKQLKALSGNALVARFTQLAKTTSDDVATKAKGGAMGWKALAEVKVTEKSLNDVKAVKTFPAVVGPLDDSFTSTPLLLLLKSRKAQPPKDYAKNKAKLLKEFETKSDDEAWQKYSQQVAEAAQFLYNDSALQAFKTQTDSALTSPINNNNDARNTVLDQYQQALAYSNGMDAAAIHYQRSLLYGAMKQPEQQIKELRDTIASVNSNTTMPVRLELARILRENKQNADAVKELQSLSKDLDNAPPASSPYGGNPNDALRTQIASEYDVLGRRDLAAAERKKLSTPATGGVAGLGGAGGNNQVITIPGGGAKR